MKGEVRVAKINLLGCIQVIVDNRELLLQSSDGAGVAVAVLLNHLPFQEREKSLDPK